MAVRMRKEPMIYGMSHDEPKDDPQLGNKRNEITIQAARQLSSPAVKMIRYDEVNNSFAITDLGLIRLALPPEDEECRLVCNAVASDRV
jgi:antiviral helicase SLH1